MSLKIRTQAGLVYLPLPEGWASSETPLGQEKMVTVEGALPDDARVRSHRVRISFTIHMINGTINHKCKYHIRGERFAPAYSNFPSKWYKFGSGGQRNTATGLKLLAEGGR